MQIGSEYRWVLEGFTPDTIPMNRLAEYMQQLAKLLGQEASVRFVRVEKNCVALVSKVDGGVAAGRVDARVSSVRRGDGPQDAMRAYQTLNGMVAQDDTSAALRKGSATVIRFPGIHVEPQEAIEIHDSGSVVAYLYMLYEAKDHGFHARFRMPSGGTLMCTVSGAIAIDLRKHLFETVKIFGRGLWRRDGTGKWEPTKFEIAEVVKIEDSSLRQVFEELRSLDIEWPDDPLQYIFDINSENGTIQ